MERDWELQATTVALLGADEDSSTKVPLWNWLSRRYAAPLYPSLYLFFLFSLSSHGNCSDRWAERPWDRWKGNSVFVSWHFSHSHSPLTQVTYCPHERREEAEAGRREESDTLLYSFWRNLMPQAISLYTGFCWIIQYSTLHAWCVEGTLGKQDTKECVVAAPACFPFDSLKGEWKVSAQNGCATASQSLIHHNYISRETACRMDQQLFCLSD